MEIKKINTDYLNDVINLYNETLSTIENKYWFREVKPDFFEQAIASGGLYGSFDGDKLVAVSTLLIKEPDFDISEDFISLNLNIATLALFMVKPDYRNKGIMYNLNLFLIDQAKQLGCNAVVSCIHPTNIAGIKTFDKLGDLRYVSFKSYGRDYPEIIYGVKI